MKWASTPLNLSLGLQSGKIQTACSVTETRNFVSRKLSNPLFYILEKGADQTVCTHRLVCTIFIRMQQNQVL